MANALKLIIPLLDESLTLNDFSQEAGFSDAYLEDINRPSLVNHIFLLYDGNLDTVSKLERDEKLRKCNTLYSRKTIYIDKKPYLLYIFVIVSRSIIRIRDGNIPYSPKDLTRIMLFWNLTDDFINDLMIYRNKTFTTEGIIVPEEDYIPSWEDEFEETFL